MRDIPAFEMRAIPAFPVSHPDFATFGMTLRDYFAAKAMQGLCAANNMNAKNIAEAAYIVADAMLKARMK